VEDNGAEGDFGAVTALEGPFDPAHAPGIFDPELEMGNPAEMPQGEQYLR